MTKKLKFKGKILRAIKHHKQKTPLQATISVILLVILISLLNVFDQPQKIKAEEDGALVNATIIGDIMLSRYVGKAVQRHGYDKLFQSVHPLLRVSDYVTGNLNNPVFSELELPRDKRAVSKAGVEAVAALKKANFTTINLANDHVLDYGTSGLQDTLHILEQAGITGVGAGYNLSDAEEIAYQEVNGITIATLGFSAHYSIPQLARENKPGILPLQPQVMIPLIEEARKNSNLVVVHLYWGRPYSSNVTSVQKDTAKTLADLGADIIIGHGQHMVAPLEIYNRSLIFYSLGNFIYDQGLSRTKESILAQYQLFDNGVARVTLYPLWIREAQPRPLAGPLHWHRRKRLLHVLTKDIGEAQNWFVVGDKVIIEMNHSHALAKVDRNAE